jgi:vacuolar-type H+-ATPase subunit E/Vma4
MGLRELVLALEREAQAQAAAIVADATADATRRRADAAALLDRQRARDLETLRAELSLAATAAIDGARRNATHQGLAARSALLDTLRAQARERIAALPPDPAMTPGVTGDVEAALAYLGPVSAVVRCPPAWGEFLQPVFAGRPIRFEPDVTVGAGMLLHDREGRLEVDATLVGRLDRLWPAVAIELAAILESSA